jgi:hypothetical protein
VLAEIAGAASRTLSARPHGIGREEVSRAIPVALAQAGLDARAIAWVYDSTSGDPGRDAWQTRLLDAALAPGGPPRTSLRPHLGAHAGIGALGVAAAAWTAGAGRLPGLAGPARTVARGPGLVYGIARGGTEVALVIR